MSVTHRRGNQQKNNTILKVLRSTDSKTSARLRTAGPSKARQIFENVCTEVSSPGNALLSKRTFAESNQRNQSQRQWNPTKLSTSCLSRNRKHSHSLSSVTTVTTLTFSLSNLLFPCSCWDQKTSPHVNQLLGEKKKAPNSSSSQICF